MKKGNAMLKTLTTLIALLTVLFMTGCAISPAYSYGPPRGGVYYSSPAPYYYAPAPYYSPWRRSYGYGHRHWR